MSLKNRVGVFFFLAGLLFLFIFATSMFSPTGEYALLPLFGGAGLVVVGWRWRSAKGGAPFNPHGPRRAAAPTPGPAGMPSKKPAVAKSAKPPAGGGKPGPAGGKPSSGPPKGKK